MKDKVYNLKFLQKSSKRMFLGCEVGDGVMELKDPSDGSTQLVQSEDLEKDFCADIGNVLRPKFKRIEDNQLQMIPDLPMDNPGALKEEESANCLNENLAKAMNRRNIQVSDIVKGTGIAWGTIMGWVYGGSSSKGVRTQLADDNLLNLITYLNCSSDWLCFGIGEDDRPITKFEKKNGTYE